MESAWKQWKGRKVRMIIEDYQLPPKARDGVIVDITSTHVFLDIEGKSLPVPFLLTSIKRVDLKDD